MLSTARLNELFGLTGKVALVTGSGSGIGKQIAILLAEVGAHVVVADRLQDAADGTKSQIAAAGGEAVAFACDVSDEVSVRDMFDTATKTVGTIDILVNNAGIFPFEDFLNITVPEMDRILSVNVRGTMLCTQSAVRNMRAGRKGGRIINLTSAAALRPVCTDSTMYAASKAAIASMTQSTALEFAKDGILVNAVAPGGIVTEGAIARQSGNARSPAGPITQPGRMLIDRYGNPNDIAAAVLFLAGSASSYITGQVLSVDGGFNIS